MWSEREDYRDINALIGKTLESVDRLGDSELTFVCVGGERYRMAHMQNCCEDVRITQVDGDLADLVGAEIKMAEVVDSSNEPAPLGQDSYTWSFYKLGTTKGYVTIRWLGESNGYYSESVDFFKVR